MGVDLWFWGLLGWQSYFFGGNVLWLKGITITEFEANHPMAYKLVTARRPKPLILCIRVLDSFEL